MKRKALGAIYLKPFCFCSGTRRLAFPGSDIGVSIAIIFGRGPELFDADVRIDAK